MDCERALSVEIFRKLDRVSRRALFMLAVMFALQGCAVEWTREHRLYCRMDEQLQIRDTLYFGLSIPGGGTVSDADWTHFETDVLAHSFAAGSTVVDAHGAWRGPDGDAVSEPSRVVVIVHADDAASDAVIRDVVQRYRSAFHQQAVLRERAAVCASF
jgi:hypothetical protein